MSYECMPIFSGIRPPMWPVRMCEKNGHFHVLQYTVHVHVSYVLPIVVIGNKIIHAPIRKNAMKSSIFECLAKFQWNLVEGGLLYQADVVS